MDFLADFFTGKRPDDYILVWTFPDRLARWFRTADEAYQAALKAAADHVYFGLATRPADFVQAMRASGSSARGTDEQVAEHFALWVDLDVQGPNHRKQNLPPDLDTAHEILGRLELPPSTVVASGGGLQAYWMLDAPAQCNDPATRDAFAKAILGWQAHIRGIAREMGAWDVDSTHDLSRVLRVPGTYNRKTEPPAMCIVQIDNGARYPLSAFAPWAATELLTPKQVNAPTLVFDQNADLPLSKWSSLFGPDTLEPKAKQSWERKRKDMPDQSASGYDMSIAGYAVRAGWSDQEIMNALLANHRHHGEVFKRQEYYARTIRRAREGTRQEQATVTIEEYADERSESNGVPADLPAPRRTELLDSISASLGVRIERIIKYLSDPPSYRLITVDGSIAIRDVDGIINHGRLKSAIAAMTGRVINDVRGPLWRNVSQLLLDLCEPQDVGLEATDKGSMHVWLGEYLSDMPPQEDNPANQKQGLPYTRDGNVYVTIRHFSTWLNAKYAVKESAKALGCLLRHIDAVNETRTIQRDGRTSTTTVWRLPSAFVAHQGGEEER